MLAKASQRFLSNIKDYGSDGPGRWRHQESISGMERRAQFTPSSGSFRFEVHLSRFERSGGLELISRGEFEQGAELARSGGVPQLAQGLGFDLAWRIRSRVRANVWPTSSSVCWLPSSIPKRILMIFSRVG
jgi:hypothetical protein